MGTKEGSQVNSYNVAELRWVRRLGEHTLNGAVPPSTRQNELI